MFNTKFNKFIIFLLFILFFYFFTTSNLTVQSQSQSESEYIGSWYGNFKLTTGNPNLCSSQEAIEFTVNEKGDLDGRTIDLKGNQLIISGSIKSDGSFFTYNVKDTKIRGNFGNEKFIGVYVNKDRGCLGNITAEKL